MTDAPTVAEETPATRTTNLTMLGNRILVKEISAPPTTASGIILPDGARKRTQRGLVVACGPGPRSPFTFEIADMGIRPGNLIMYSEMVGQEVSIDGQPFLILREEDVICTYEDDTLDADPEAE